MLYDYYNCSSVYCEMRNFQSRSYSSSSSNNSVKNNVLMIRDADAVECDGTAATIS